MEFPYPNQALHFRRMPPMGMLFCGSTQHNMMATSGSGPEHRGVESPGRGKAEHGCSVGGVGVACCTLRHILCNIWGSFLPFEAADVLPWNHMLLCFRNDSGCHCINAVASSR